MSVEGFVDGELAAQTRSVPHGDGQIEHVMELIVEFMELLDLLVRVSSTVWHMHLRDRTC